MAKLYSKNSPKKAKKRNPRKETVSFLLNYSKALEVRKHKDIEFETILN